MPHDLCRVLPRLVQRDDRRDLDRLERAVVEVRLQAGERRESRRVPEREADPPPRHRERLRERVDLDRDIRGAGHLQHRRRPVAVERDVRVGEVVHEQRLVLPCQAHEPLEQREVDHARRRVVRERDDDRPRRRRRARARGGEAVVQLVVVAVELDRDDGRPGQHGRLEVDRVARRRHDRDVAGLDEHPHQVREALLRADRRHRLRLGIELDAEAVGVEVADRARAASGCLGSPSSGGCVASPPPP